jgi:hypothetical protein
MKREKVYHFENLCRFQTLEQKLSMRLDGWMKVEPAYRTACKMQQDLCLKDL